MDSANLEDCPIGLSDLPTEVLEIVFMNVLERNAFHFFCLAKTCRRFRDVICNTLVPPLVEGKMSHSTAISVCGLIDESVAEHWVEECDSYYPMSERTPTAMAQSFLAFHPGLEVNNPKVTLDESAGDIPKRATLPSEYIPFVRWKDEVGIAFHKQAGEPKLPSHTIQYINNFEKAHRSHIRCNNRVVFYVNVTKGTFGIYVDTACTCVEDIAKPFRMYATQAAFHGGHVTSCHMFFNTLCLGTSNGRIYAFCVNRLNDLYDLDLTKPDYATKVGQAEAIRQIEIVIGPTGRINIGFSHEALKD